MDKELSLAKTAVLADPSAALPPNARAVKGYDFNKGVDFSALLAQADTMGMQSSNLHKAMRIVEKMIQWRGENAERCKIFLGFTSNMVSSGMREIFRYLCEHKLVDVVVTTAGGVEEDLMKCLANHLLGDFPHDDSQLRQEGFNRIGNMFVPNANYCRFEDWLTPLLDEMWDRQQEGATWTPSKMIDFLGSRIGSEESIYYWCHKNEIPVFCPAITDGSLGDMLFFHSYRRPGLVVDLVEDIRRINSSAMHAPKTGVIILGAGVIKHHILNANLMRNGADFAVYVNTAAEFDCSDAGAAPSEAVSWGKLRPEVEAVKLFAEASLVFPLIVAETFARVVEQRAKGQHTVESKASPGDITTGV